MNKDILLDYIDACELVKETEADIKKLRKTEMVYDKVSGSNPDFPYQAPLIQHAAGTTDHWFEHAKEQNLKHWIDLVRRTVGKG